jgi:beta-xylosidase
VDRKGLRHVLPAVAVVLLISAGGCDLARSQDTTAFELSGNPVGVTHGIIDFQSLESWTRHPDNPVYRDEIPGYEVASDGHVFFDPSGQLRMIYTGDTDDHTSIKMAVGSSFDTWEEVGTILPGDTTPGGERSGKETAFYHYAEAIDTHQIYYIGYADGDSQNAYEAEIYLARADSVEGPYEMADTPIVPNGSHAGHEVHLMTSPSVVEHEGDLYLTFIGWDAPPDVVTEIWMMGAVSTDNGQTWSAVEEVETPIGVEGQVTKGPDGMYYALRTGDYRRDEAIYLARGEHPFGPYNDAFEEPVLTKDSWRWEGDEIIAPQVTFDPTQKRAFLYYTGARHLRGWWMMVAQTPYTAAD